MRPHWSERLKKRIAELERKCDIFSTATRQANEENKQLREAFRTEQVQRAKAEKQAHDLKLENIRLNLENKQLQSEFIDQRSLQDALYKSSKKVKNLKNS
jgi:hypothetical protein